MSIKKIISVLVVTAMMFTMLAIPVTANAVETNSTAKITVHYYNQNNWNNPYIYYYSDSNKPVVWPGNAMNADGDNWYSYTINNIENAKVIFSDNGNSQNPKQNQEGFTVSGEKWYACGAWYDSEPQGITVHYQNYNNWNNVNLYWYNSSQKGTAWPGNAMSADGDGWYTYKIFGVEQAKVLFNNGSGTQTPGQNQEGVTISGEKWYRNGELTDSRPDQVTVFFYNPNGWNAPNIYYYKNTSDTGKVWPGEAMKSVGNNWYSYTITKYSSAKVLFNSGTNQIPDKNQEGFDVSGTMWYKDGKWCNGETDRDNDTLPDYMEMILNTDINKADTDGDGLPDGYEVLNLSTDPLKADSDSNGTNDGDEDSDSDGLTNKQEYTLGTDPTLLDTDNDGLNDGDEVNVYYTDPLKADTDGDTLSDGDDVALGFSPLLQDTNGNGILDCDEKVQQNITETVKSNDKPQITDVSVNINGTGNVKNNTTIESIYGKDALSSDVVGLVGVPVEITSDSTFDTAVITFKYDESKLGNTPEENLAIMWYDEENGIYQLLDKDTVLDKENNTVSYNTKHFSKYMVVDKEVWYNTWRTNIDYRSGSGTNKYYDFAFVCDISGSMSGSSISYAKTALNNFIDCMSDNDNGSVIAFDSSAYLLASFGSSKDKLHSAVNSMNARGGTNVSAGLTMGVNQLVATSNTNEKAVILICDGDVNYIQPAVNTAVANNIKIYPINVVASDNKILQSVADQTGGELYYAYTAEQLLDAFSHISSNNLLDFDLTDTDGDGLPDTFEKNGMRTTNGKIIYTDPTKADTDGDGISDGDEMGLLRKSSALTIQSFDFPTLALPDIGMYFGNGLFSKNVFMFQMNSHPNEPDSDGDGLLDNAARIINGKEVAPEDPDPFICNGPVGVWQKQIEIEEKNNIASTYLNLPYIPDFNPLVSKNTADILVNFALNNRNLLLENEDLVHTLTQTAKSIYEGGTLSGAYLLNFKADNKQVAYHSQVNTWQRQFGFNDMYDDIFRICSNMLKEKFIFSVDGTEYVLWTWKGDYWNMQSGGEVGLYEYNREITTTKQYDAVDFELPMTLNLYNYYNSKDITSIFNWAPTEKQWWITGFNPNFTEPNPYDMVLLGSVNFTGHEDLYNSLKNSMSKDIRKNYMIFDDTNRTVWLTW